jgi:ribosomal protein S18 acetylase RimI-like enzyme
MTEPTADLSVRVAWAQDAAGIADVQVAAWRERYAAVLPTEVLRSLEPAAFAEQWVSALTRPKDARHRVLVALARTSIEGFAMTVPSADPDADPVSDGEIAELVVAPTAQRVGHGSRLLHACADTLRSDGFSRATIWLAATDDALRRFLTVAGWGTDGAYRELDLHGDGSITVRQVRLHTDLSREH